MGILSSLGLGSSDEHAPPAMVATQVSTSTHVLHTGCNLLCWCSLDVSPFALCSRQDDGFGLDAERRSGSHVWRSVGCWTCGASAEA